MPGAWTNPTLNPLQSYLEFSGGKPNAEADYNAGISKGYAWDGKGWTYKGGGDPANWTEAMKKGAAAGDDASRWGAGGAPMSGYGPSSMGAPGGAPGGGGTSSLATGGSVASGGTGPYKADAQLAQIRDDFRRMTEQGQGQINEDLNSRGIFSSGVGAKLSNDYRTQMGQQEGSAIERLMNDIMGRNQASELAKEQFAWQKQLAMMSGGSNRFSGGDTGGNPNQELMAMFQQMMGGGGGSTNPAGGYSSKGDTFSDKWGGNMGDLPKGKSPVASPGAQNALADLMAQYNMMKSVNPAGAEALKAQIYALGGSV